MACCTIVHFCGLLFLHYYRLPTSRKLLFRNWGLGPTSSNLLHPLQLGLLLDLVSTHHDATQSTNSTTQTFQTITTKFCNTTPFFIFKQKPNTTKGTDSPCNHKSERAFKVLKPSSLSFFFSISKELQGRNIKFLLPFLPLIL